MEFDFSVSAQGFVYGNFVAACHQVLLIKANIVRLIYSICFITTQRFDVLLAINFLSEQQLPADLYKSSRLV